MPTPEIFYTAHPDVITQAIKTLCAVVMLLGSGFIGTILYIWHKMDARIGTIEDKMGKIANSIEGMDKSTSVEISNIKLRCSLIHPNNPHAHVRASDLIDLT